MALAQLGATDAGGGNRFLMPLAAPGEAPANLVSVLQDRYGASAEDKKLGRK